MGVLNDFSKQQLLDEIARREVEESKPPPLKSIDEVDWTPVYVIAAKHINDIYQHGFADEDDKQYIYEAVLISIFGNEIWAWQKKIARERG